MNNFFTFLLLFLNISIFSQYRIKVYDHDEKDSIIYILENDKIYACPIKKNIGKTNKCEAKEELSFNTNKYLILKNIFKNNLKVTSIMPTFKISSYSPNVYYGYDLPYKKGEQYKVTQGYNGDYSHIGINALDFDMPEGTKVVAVRDGVVIEMVEDNNKGCPTDNCAKYANYVSILHSDQTVAKYSHLQYKGIKVKIGDKVKKGDLIGFSGNTGKSNGSHLHFSCHLNPASNETLKTLFKTGKGNRLEYLREGETYLKNY
ncbi:MULTISPECIES: M23 family metallopeptidase [Chryseobacterium]|uniref:Murein DD-endopeptidase MepM/ murein hydrolase activator NlpD n=1 Tax=Chryseobacterium camelliae TaxID=1265445 RepID=A0ABU0TK92_9FLAO|nr:MULTISPECIES: M23 family metallopeptidase [Chryseobacterium]MDT3408682.1 murein DD-endopeptidase MepM/ murein hydrolase activator NlpD [Pseudacidovorax intermedius]MDQ1097464.1 murein DD-endopeptidase MepM/ murein hydrolase activator NlpD [Chryseobacterium camelliae]MDQ1101393.1 murein DD-endopeptidase MepM/ murein hydrolase activator NlpD [Chryseobacterium sp. SORGH_AS_1048]MDR6084837.1 murein DD-endopeptidase MepM/ murein hydrolase activator NlpD [Chryseobacterium sp. SORGH_AS_0909]MDR612